jgi:hypothetical protein
MESSTLIIVALTSLWLTTVYVAYKLEKRQADIQMRLQDREVEWLLYTHLLRTEHIRVTGRRPPEIPEKLQRFISDDDIDKS